MSGWIGISLGDPGGIGAEVTVKALARLKPGKWKFLLLGDPAILQKNHLQTNLPVRPFRTYEEDGVFFIFNPGTPLPSQFERGGRAPAQAAMASLEDGARPSLRGELAGLVTAP